MPPSTTVPIVLATWVAGVVLATIVLSIVHGDPDSDPSIPALAASLVALWAVYLAGVAIASRRAGTGRPADDVGFSFAPVDALGIPIGAASQLLLVPLVYAPLRSIWPDTFDEEALEETARELVDRASGATSVLLFVLVVVGAPIVEEVFFRGLLQRPLLGRFSTVPVVVTVAAAFALIHFRPVEYPGLFAFGVVLGTCAWATGRLGMAIAAHMTFNLVGLVVVS
jgi:membrane protease YdiL (CAAX protease family)